jgi:hypothetical protein
LSQENITILRNGHLVSRASDYIIYSVEAAAIGHVVKEYGPCMLDHPLCISSASCFVLCGCLLRPVLSYFDPVYPCAAFLFSEYPFLRNDQPRSRAPSSAVKHLARTRRSRHSRSFFQTMSRLCPATLSTALASIRMASHSYVSLPVHSCLGVY